MHKGFETKTWSYAVASGCVLFASIVLLLYCSQLLTVAKNDLGKVASVESQVRQLRADLVSYDDSLARLGLDKGMVPKREPLDFSAAISRDQLGTLQELLLTTYKSDGFFFLKSFELVEKQGREKGDASYLHLNFQGEKVVVFWES